MEEMYNHFPYADELKHSATRPMYAVICHADQSVQAQKQPMSKKKKIAIGAGLGLAALGAGAAAYGIGRAKGAGLSAKDVGMRFGIKGRDYLNTAKNSIGGAARRAGERVGQGAKNLGMRTSIKTRDAFNTMKGGAANRFYNIKDAVAQRMINARERRYARRAFK